jgi:hypothetical protein
MKKITMILILTFCLSSIHHIYAQKYRYPDIGFNKTHKRVIKGRATKITKYTVSDLDTLKEESYFDLNGNRIKDVSYEFEQIGRQTFYKWDKGLLVSIVQTSAIKDTAEFDYSYEFPTIRIYENVRGKKELIRELFYNSDSTNSLIINYTKGKVWTIDSIKYNGSTISAKFYEKGKLSLENITYIVDYVNEIGYTLIEHKMTGFTKKLYNDSMDIIQEIRETDSNVVITNYNYLDGKLISENEIYNGCKIYSSFYKYE